MILFAVLVATALFNGIHTAPQFRLTAAEYEALKVALEGNIPTGIQSADPLLSVVDEDPENYVVVNFGSDASADSGAPANRGAPADSGIPADSGALTIDDVVDLRNNADLAASAAPVATPVDNTVASSNSDGALGVSLNDAVSALNQEALVSAAEAPVSNQPASDTAPAPAPVDIPAPAPVDAPAPAPVDIPAPAPVDVPAPAPVDVPAPVDIPAPAPVDIPAAAPAPAPAADPVAPAPASNPVAGGSGGFGVPLPSPGLNNGPVLSQVGGTEILSGAGGSVAVSDFGLGPNTGSGLRIAVSQEVQDFENLLDVDSLFEDGELNAFRGESFNLDDNIFRSNRVKRQSQARQLGGQLASVGGLLGGALGRYLDSSANAKITLIDDMESLGLLVITNIENMLEDDNKEDEEDNEDDYDFNFDFDFVSENKTETATEKTAETTPVFIIN